MSTSGFRLPCQCGQFVTVTKRQAGQETICQACGSSLVVPGLLELGRCESADVEEKKPAAAERKGTGCIFSTCLFIVGISIIAASVLFYLSHLWTPRDEEGTRVTMESIADQAFQRIDESADIGLLQIWDEFDRVGLGEPEPPQFVLALRTGQRLWNAAAATAGIAVLAFIVAVGMLVKDLSSRRATKS